MHKFVLLTLVDDAPVIINVSDIASVWPAVNPEHSEVVDFNGECVVVQEEVKLVFEMIKDV